MSSQPPLFDLPDAPAADADAAERIEREFVLLAQTAHAIGVSRDGSQNKAPANTIWLPKSQIDFDIYGTAVLVDLPAWLAREKGISE